MMAYERLLAWRAAHELALAVYRSTEAFPKNELYGLTAQLRRAAFSVAANIAEGAVKRGSGEFRRFLDIAVGSLAELAYGVTLATDLKLMTDEQRQALEALRVQAAKLTWGLYKKMRDSAKQTG